MADKVGEKVEIICPTGACGNIASGYVAYEMGLPIEMVAAVTPNDIVHRTFSNGDFSLRVRDLMAIFESESQTKIPEDILQKMREVVVDTKAYNNDQMIDTMKRCHRENDYIICPHTAVGMAYMYNNKKNLPQIVLATAAPDKFPEAVELSNITPNKNPDIEKLLTMETRIEKITLAQQG